MPVKTRARYENSDRFGLLLAALVTVYVLSAFVTAYWVRAVQAALFLLVSLLAVRTSRVGHRTARLMIMIAVGGSVIALVLALAVPTGPCSGVAFLWMALVLLLAVILLVRRVLASRQDVTLQSIFGAISAYVIIGLMFSSVYAAISKFGGGTFFADGGPGDAQTFQYFSFTTLTTVGYGDFTAAASGGRAVAVMEALIGQVFLATLVARLVSAYRAPGRTGSAEHVRSRPALGCNRSARSTCDHTMPNAIASHAARPRQQAGNARQRTAGRHARRGKRPGSGAHPALSVPRARGADPGHDRLLAHLALQNDLSGPRVSCLQAAGRATEFSASLTVSGASCRSASGYRQRGGWPCRPGLSPCSPCPAAASEATILGGEGGCARALGELGARSSWYSWPPGRVS